jgi:putative ABC transport system substrate-binding protein
MKRITFSIACGTIFFAVCFFAEAQQAKKVASIGYLSNGSSSSESTRSNGVRLALREFGYIEGQNISIAYRYAEAKAERYADLVTDLVGIKVDVIVVAGGSATVRAAMKGTKTIPIVMIGSGADPVEAGLVESLARPGGNVTGITNLSRELTGKRLELLKEAVPKLSRVAVLYESNTPGAEREIKEDLPVAARALKLTSKAWEIRVQEDLETVLSAISKDRPDGIVVTSSPLLSSNRQKVVGFALNSRMPAMYHRAEYMEAGGLMYYGADVVDGYRQVAWYIDKILKGAKPAELPVQQPTKFEFVINLQTAKKMGLTINADVLARATKIIK